MLAVTPSDTSRTAVAAPGVIVRLAGSPFGGYTALDGKMRFDQVVPGTYLFEATTPLHEVIEATAARTAVTVAADTLVEARVTLKPLAQAAAEVCPDYPVGPGEGILAGRLTVGENASPAPNVKVTVEWTGGDREVRSRGDGYYRLCGVPRGMLLLVRASANGYMVTQSLTLAPTEIVRPLDLELKP